MSFLPSKSGCFLRSWWRMALVSLAAVFALWLAAPPAQASGEEIHVISDHREIKFPGVLAFNLTAEADAEIVEVRIFYRTLDHGNWAYAYLRFPTGPRITASIDINATGNVYLPPGARLEYYYVIRDALGNEHRTAPTVFDYTDTRFQWEQIQIGPLALFYHDLSDSRLTSVSSQVEPELERIADLLPAPVQGSMRGVIYNRRSAAVDAFPFQSETITEQRVFQGYSFPENGVFVGLGLQPGVIVHETAHLMLNEALRPSLLPVPAWLDEGFASYVEPGSSAYGGRSFGSRELPLAAMATQPGTPRGIATFYRKAESVVAYLIEEHGSDQFRSFLGEFRQGGTVNDALVNTYGFDVDGLEALWAGDPEGSDAPGPSSLETPSPFLYFDVWILGGLALAVLVVVVLRSLGNKLRRQPETDEGFQPWEDPTAEYSYGDDDYPR